MKAAQLIKMGVPATCLETAFQGMKQAVESGLTGEELENALHDITAVPEQYLGHDLWGELAGRLVEAQQARAAYVERKEPAPVHIWGNNPEQRALDQLENARRLPVAVAVALMPDAHMGYGLPIGGVLATENSVIPYAVGVDIACRMRLSVLDLPVSALKDRRQELIEALEEETRFGVGARFKERREHAVMDDPAWQEIPVLAEAYTKAARQLGTSGGGNHFVEYGVLEVLADAKDNGLGLAPGQYLALMSHSGSRGTGERVAKHYSRLAMDLRPELPEELRHLAWLDLDSDEGREYWRAMELMGRYSSANHELIHRHVTERLGVGVLAMVENHHNFAWKEKHLGKDLVVHRKGATPAAKGVLGVIPGSMATPAYVVRGKGKPESLDSASHGAGRAMSRKQAENSFTGQEMNAFLEKNRVTLLSAGLDEAPMAYKDIEEVMAAQRDLVEPVARFEPRLVKMAPPARRPGWRRKKRGNKRRGAEQASA